MQIKYKVIISIAIIVTAAAIGRYTAPDKIKIETKTVEIIKEVKVESKDRTKKKDKTYEKTTTTNADGTSTTIVKIAEKDSDHTKDNTTSTNDISVAKDETKEVTKSGSKTNLSFLAGVNPLNPSSGMTYGGHVTKDILGPISIGIWGLSNGTCGASIGLTL